MPQIMLIVGLCGGLAGAVMVTLADAWLSRLLLTYLDGVDSNVAALAEAMRTGQTQVVVTGIDIRRDNRLDRARHFKTFGWLTIAIAFALQLAGAWLISSTSTP